MAAEAEAEEGELYQPLPMLAFGLLLGEQESAWLDLFGHDGHLLGARQCD